MSGLGLQVTVFRQEIEPKQENLPYKVDYIHTEDGIDFVVRNPKGNSIFQGPDLYRAIEHRDKCNKRGK